MAFLTRADDGERFELTGDDLRIGRAPDNRMVLADRSISRYHARVVKTDEGFLILDEKSENGVVVNGERVKNRFLRDGDRIELGNITLRYSADIDLEATINVDAPKMVKPPAPSIATPPVAQKPIPPPPPQPKPAPPPITPIAPTPAPAPTPGIIEAADARREAASPMRRWILIAVAAIALFAAYRIVRFMRGPQSMLAFKMHSDNSVAKIAPELAPLGPMTRVRVKPEVVEVTKAGAKIPIKDGAHLDIPPDAFDGPTKIETSVISLGLEHFDFSMRDSWAYVIKTVGDDKVDLKKTITLEIPFRPEAIRVAQLNGDTWQRIDIPPGRTSKVTIGHFSSKIFEVGKSNVGEEAQASAPTPTASDAEPTPEQMAEMERLQKEREEHAKKLARERLENSNEATRRFYGVNERASHSTEQNCNDLTAVLEDFKRDAKNFDIPEGFEDASCTDLGVNWLFPGQIPSKEPNSYYWRVVAPSMEKIKKAVLASDRPLTEAQILRIAIIANDGNVLKGILAAHNFLKDVTYKGRVYPNPRADAVPDDLGQIAGHIESWRHDTNVSPAGEYDKMGPVYHLFAAATARAWCGAAWGSIAINGESASRALGTMGDKYDVEKGDADTCGRDFGAGVANLTTKYLKDPQVPFGKGIPVPSESLWKFAPNPVTGEKAPCPPVAVSTWQRKLCPWSPKDVGAEPCSPGFCWDGGFRGTLACKPEQEVPGGHRNDLNNIICADGTHMVFEECTGIPARCEPNQ